MLSTSFVYLLARILPGVFSLATIAVLTRLLSVEEYGRYALVLSIVGLLNGVLFAWNSQAVFRLLGEAAGREKDRLLRTALAAFTCSFLAVAGAATFVVFWPEQRLLPPGITAAAVLMLLGFAWIEFCGFVLNVEQRSGAYLLLLVGRAIANLLLGGGTALIFKSAVGVIFAISAGWVLLGILPAFTRSFRGSLKTGTWHDRAPIGPLLSYGLPLSLAIVLGQLLSAGDRAMLASLSSVAAVGRYAAGYDVVQFTIGALGSALSLSFYPRIIVEFSASRENADVTLQRYVALLSALIFPAAAGLALVAPALGEVLFGSGVRDGAVTIMPLICLAATAQCFKAFYTDFSFQLARKTVGSVIASGAALVVSLGADWLLIPRFGSLGAAMGSAIASSLALTISFLVGRFWAYRLPSISNALLSSGAATGLMVIVLLPLHSHVGAGWLIGEVLLGAATYFCAALVLNVANIRESVSRIWRLTK